MILMQLADPEGFKKSEEAVSGASAQIAELPFTNVLTHLQRTDVTVPQLHYYDREAGLLYLEDFGDLTLAEACRDADRAHHEEQRRAAEERRRHEEAPQGRRLSTCESSFARRTRRCGHSP